MLDADWLLDEALKKLEDFSGMPLYSLQMYPIQSFVTVTVKIFFPLWPIRLFDIPTTYAARRSNLELPHPLKEVM